MTANPIDTQNPKKTWILNGMEMGTEKTRRAEASMEMEAS
jgi:hypothetical protein